MKNILFIIGIVLISSSLFSQKDVVFNQLITKDTSDCLFPKSIINEKKELFVVYYNNGYIYYDLLSSELTKIVEHKELQISTSSYERYFEISLFDKDHFILFWISVTSGNKYLYGRIFDRYGFPTSGIINIGFISQSNYCVSEKANSSNEISISYNNGNNVIVRYLKMDATLSSEIKIFNLSGVSEQFYFTIDFLPNKNIVFHWVDYSRKIYTLLFDSNGNQLISSMLITENTTSNRIVTSLFAAHNPQGDFLIVWPHYSNDGKYKLYAQKFSKEGKLDGGILLITDTKNSMAPYIGQVDVSIDIDENWAIVWSDNLANAHAILLYGQLIDRNNNKVGSNYIVSNQGVDADLQQYDPNIQWINDQMIVCFNSLNLFYNNYFTINLNITSIDDGNVAPVFLSEIGDQEVYTQDSLIITIDNKIAYDPDMEEVFLQVIVDTLEVLPYWISVNNTEKSIKFNPQDYHCGLYKIILIVSDAKMLTKRTSFNLMVKSGHHVTSYERRILRIKDNEYPQFLLNVNDTDICNNSNLIGSQLVTVQNRQNVDYFWKEKTMSDYINSSIFEIPVNESTWIAVKTTDEFGCTRKDTILVMVNSCTYISDVSSRESISIFPNPTDGLVQITICKSLNDPKIKRVQLINNQGVLVLNESYNNLSNISLDLSNLSQGIYLVIITDTKHKQWISKILIY